MYLYDHISDTQMWLCFWPYIYIIALKMRFFLPKCVYKQGVTVEDGCLTRQNQSKTNHKSHQTRTRARDHHPERRRQNRATTHGLSRTCRHTLTPKLENVSSKTVFWRMDHQTIRVFGELIIKKPVIMNVVI